MLFRDIIGQDIVKAKLLGSIKSGRIPHAQLFLGLDGFGGLPLALAYAQYLNCTERGEEDSCGNCDSCHKHDAFIYPDLHFSFPVITKKPGEKPVSDDYITEWRKTLKESAYVDYQDWMRTIGAKNKQGNITADECRKILKKLALKPLYEGYKVLIIWQPEYLDKESNILLKTLEEPSDKTVIIMVAENEEQLLGTIKSRTQLQRIPPLKMHDLSLGLEVKLGLSHPEAVRIARLSEGDYIKAQNLNKSEENDYVAEFVEWMRACYKPDMGKVLKWTEAMSSTGRENQKNFLLYGLSLLRECSLHRIGTDSLGRSSGIEKDFVEKFSPWVGEANLEGLHNAFGDAYYFVERNANPKLLFFNLSLLINELLGRYKKAA